MLKKEFPSKNCSVNFLEYSFAQHEFSFIHLFIYDLHVFSFIHLFAMTLAVPINIVFREEICKPPFVLIVYLVHLMNLIYNA